MIEGFMDVVEGSVAELDRCLGIRRSGMAVSGCWVPDFRGLRTAEDPVNLTRRALVEPMMGLLGYSRAGPDGSVALTTAPMNSPASTMAAEAVRSIRAGPASTGIGTDGFSWVIAVCTGSGARVVGVADLRPYYIEALERRRFRAAVPADCSAASAFLEAFSRRRAIRPPFP